MYRKPSLLARGGFSFAPRRGGATSRPTATLRRTRTAQFRPACNTTGSSTIIRRHRHPIPHRRSTSGPARARPQYGLRTRPPLPVPASRPQHLRPRSDEKKSGTHMRPAPASQQPPLPVSAGTTAPDTSAEARSGRRRSPPACRYDGGSGRSRPPPYRGRRSPSHASPRCGWPPCGHRSSAP